jgi:hypothetical protein
VTFSSEERANNTNAATGPGHPTATIRRGQAGRLSRPAAAPQRERHVEYRCLMTGQGNERGAPKIFIKEENLL